MSAAEEKPRILIYILRRDLRLTDNPVFHEAAQLYQASNASFTHILPVYIFPANQIEIAGFLSTDSENSPYPEARSQVGAFWRCGPHRAKFLAESVWNVKESLEKVGSGLTIRVGTVGHVVKQMLAWFNGEDSKKGDSACAEDGSRGTVAGIWMTAEEGVEEKREERDVRRAAKERTIDFRLFGDEKYYIDDRDLPFENIFELSDIYTSYRKSLEPLRDRPRVSLPRPAKLPPYPSSDSVPPQPSPFTIPSTYDDLEAALFKPLKREQNYGFGRSTPQLPQNARSAHPFGGGESSGQARVSHLISSGSMTRYKATRNGLVGTDFSTKLSAWLALGCITARWIHWAMLAFEDGKTDSSSLQEHDPLKIVLADLSDVDQWQQVEGFNKGENDGTAGVRFELLWRDYMRLCARKFGPRLFALNGFRGEDYSNNNPSKQQKNQPPASPIMQNQPPPQAASEWKSPLNDPNIKDQLERFLVGTTGIGLVDASQRELLLTGYTSNRARQNVASFLAKHLNIDWRLGAEWYESMLTDYDVCSNWGNWQYVSGVGNDPRVGRSFNPVKQALDYDGRAEYVRMWVEEMKDADIGLNDGVVGEPEGEKLMGVFQGWRMSEGEKERLGLKGVEWVEKPLARIPFSVGRGGGGGRGRGGYRGRGRGGGRGRGRGDRDFRRRGNMDRAGMAGGPAES